MSSEKGENNKKIISESSLQAFFFQELKEVNKRSLNPLSKATIHYCGLIMDKFALSANYFEQNEGKTSEKVLGIKLLKSLHLSKNMQKKEIKEVGDLTLFLCGIFPESLNKKIVDISYYRDLGKMAYGRLNHLVPSVYERPEFFDVLTHINEGDS